MVRLAHQEISFSNILDENYIVTAPGRIYFQGRSLLPTGAVTALSHLTAHGGPHGKARFLRNRNLPRARSKCNKKHLLKVFFCLKYAVFTNFQLFC